MYCIKLFVRKWSGQELSITHNTVLLVGNIRADRTARLYAIKIIVLVVYGLHNKKFKVKHVL